MTKRNPGLPRNPRDSYPTPEKALVPAFLRMLHMDGRRFAEPCAGDGRLVSYLTDRGYHCVYGGDISSGHDAMNLAERDVYGATIVTNPPWDRKILHPMIEHFVALKRPVWLLIDADWAHTKQAVPLLMDCTHIVSIGRVRWMEGTTMDGYDNCAWYRFDKTMVEPITFIPRVE